MFLAFSKISKLNWQSVQNFIEDNGFEDGVNRRCLVSQSYHPLGWDSRDLNTKYVYVWLVCNEPLICFYKVPCSSRGITEDRSGRAPSWRFDNDDSDRDCDDDDDDDDDADELYFAHVVSTRAHARLVDVDPSEALEMSGVVDFISYKDVPAKNEFSLVELLKYDETVFATDTVSV